MVGFDGFVDEIVKAVEKRSGSSYTSFSELSAFAERIASFSGKSGNIELVPQQKKIGGNAPILAEALLQGGHKVTLAGPLEDPIFEPLSKRCEKVYSLGAPGQSTAVEFTDGKVIFGKMGSLVHLTSAQVLEKIPNLLSILEASKLFASVNWTMLPMMNSLWKDLLENIFPKLTKKKRILFVDLADPAKREDKEIVEGFRLLSEMGPFFEVHLGLNLREAERAASLFQIPFDSAKLQESVEKLKKAIGIPHILLHSTRLACDGISLIKTPYVEKPLLTTGAGDNFNGGYLNALLFGFNNKEALQFGVSTASFYVSHGKSPSLEELALFLGEWIN